MKQKKLQGTQIGKSGLFLIIMRHTICLEKGLLSKYYRDHVFVQVSIIRDAILAHDRYILY